MCKSFINEIHESAYNCFTYHYKSTVNKQDNVCYNTC